MTYWTHNMDAVFDRLVWLSDPMLLDQLVFRLQHYKSDNWADGEHFMFYKTKTLVDQYERYLRRRSEIRPRHLMELGVYDGGSVAFGNEVLRPEKHVAVDLRMRGDSAYFRQYVSGRGLSDRVRTFWNTDQADKARLRELVDTELNGSLDLVIDDASHLYAPTLASFEALFPSHHPGGSYIIEDWAWGHWPEFIAPGHAWAREAPLTKLVVQLIEVVGTTRELIANLSVYQGFVVIERGPQVLDDARQFSLEDHIVRRPHPGLATRLSRLKTTTLTRLRRALH